MNKGINEGMESKQVETTNTGNPTVDNFLKNTPQQYQEAFKKILGTDPQKGEQIIQELDGGADGMPFSWELSSAIEDEDDYTSGVLSGGGKISNVTTVKGQYSIGNLTVFYGDPLTLKLNGEEYQKVNKQDFLDFLDQYLKIMNSISN